jgi:hypothetical protein
MVKLLVSTTVVLIFLFASATAHAQGTPTPHVFTGVASIDNQPVPSGTAVAALVDGQTVARAFTDGSQFTLRLQETAAGAFQGKAVTFRVNGLIAQQASMFQPFGFTTLNLNVSSFVPVSVALVSISATVQRVWHFDNGLGRWTLWDPESVLASDLTSLQQGKGYLFVVRQPAILTVGGFTYQLQPGINMIGWMGY